MDVSFNNGIKEEKFYGFSENYRAIQNSSFGGFSFFDITYAVIDISFAYGILEYVSKYNKNNVYNAGSMTQLGFGLTGKYPFIVGEITYYPIFGINYNMVLASKNEDGITRDISTVKNMSQFGILTGLGLDLQVSDFRFWRMEFLFNLRFPMKIFENFNGDTTLGVGPRFKLGYGFKF